MPNQHTRVAFIAMTLSLSAVLVAQQPPPPANVQTAARDGASAPVGTGVIAGRVVTMDAERQPVRRAMVSLYPGTVGFGGSSAARFATAAATQTVVTDDQGRFEFDGLPAGRYMMELRKASYRSTFYGATSSQSQGLAVALADGQRMTNLVAQIARGAIVAGRVVDQNNNPIVGARIVALQRVLINGVPVFRDTNAGSIGTDDRGVYRFYGFEAGTYVVAAQVGAVANRVATPEEFAWAERGDGTAAISTIAPPPSRPLKYANVYYPGVTNAADAIALTFANGQEHAGIDIVVPLVPTATVSGRVLNAEGQPVRSTSVMLQRLGGSVMLGSGGFAQVQPDGSFSVEGLEPGGYTLSARGSSGQTPTQDLWATSELTIAGSDINDVSVRLQPTLSVSGRVVLESSSATPPADLAGRVTVTARSAPGAQSGGAANASTRADGSFVLPGLTPGSYIFSASFPGSTSWVLSAATTGGRDIADTPFEIRAGEAAPEIAVRFIDRPTEVSGVLLDKDGKPAPEYSVIVFSTTRAHWIQGARRLPTPTRPASDGQYSIKGLPPGEYYLAALTNFDPQEWYTVPFLEQLLPNAIKITLAEGEKKVQALRLRQLDADK